MDNINSLDKISVSELIGSGDIQCKCGRIHSCGLKIYNSYPGAINTITEVLDRLEVRRPYLVCDINTYDVAGKKVEDILKSKEIEYSLYMFNHSHLEPDERSVGELTMELNDTYDSIIAIGSGVINDICKIIAYISDRPQIIIATAPSMDGYASSSSSMNLRGVKTTIYNKTPDAIIADTDILCKAPIRMLQAGLGDMIAKYISICEWRIAAIITGEYYCEEVAKLVRLSLKKIMEASDGLLSREPDTIRAINDGLVLSGIAMAYAGVSRPASGMEHYFSHLWEMMAEERGYKSDFHGIQVAIGTLLTLKLYEVLRYAKPDIYKSKVAYDNYSYDDWIIMIRKIFANTSDEIIRLEEIHQKNSKKNHSDRLVKIIDNWSEIISIIQEELPSYDSIYNLMSALNMPLSPSDIGISIDTTIDAYMGSREIRDKYVCSSLLWDMGLLEEYKEVIRGISR